MELSDYRARIDQIDRQLVELFAQRMNTAAGIVAYKKEHGLPVDLGYYGPGTDNPARQVVVLSPGRMTPPAGIAANKKEPGLRVLAPVGGRKKLLDVAAQAPEDMRDYTASLYTMLFELSRCYQGRLLGSTSPLTTEIQTAIDQTPNLFPSNVSVACQGVAGGPFPPARPQPVQPPPHTYLSPLLSGGCRPRTGVGAAPRGAPRENTPPPFSRQRCRLPVGVWRGLIPGGPAQGF